MAISKKSLGKVLALSMASAMAMSSLSAALVSVAAVQDPALASNGSVGFYNDGEKQIVAALRGAVKGTDGKYTITGVGDNKEVDTIVGNKFELAKVFDESFFEKILEYTDSDDLAVQDLDVTKVTYRVSSGGSYASVKDDILTAKKAGTATLQIKVTADVDLGGGKSDKEVTFTHNVNIIVHDNAEIGLVAYNSSAHTQYNRLTNDQLNDIAAYNADKLEFQLVSFRSQGAGTEATGSAKTNVTVTKNGSTTTETIDNAKFAAIAVDASIGDSATSTIPEDKPQPGQAIDKVVDADNLSKAGLANSANAIAAFKALLTDTNGTVTIAPAANIPAKLQALVTAGTIKTTDVLIPESTTGAGDAVTVDDVIKDTTPAAGTPAQKLKDALDKAVSDVDKPGDTPDKKLDDALAASGLTTAQQNAVKKYSSVDEKTGKVTVDAAKFNAAKTADNTAPVADLSKATNAVGLATQYANAVSTEATGALTDGLFRDGVPAAAVSGALRLNNVAVLGQSRTTDETTLYFTKKDASLSGVASKLLVAATSDYKYYDATAKALTDTQAQNEEVSIYKLKAEADLQKETITLADVKDATEMEALLNAATNVQPSTPPTTDEKTLTEKLTAALEKDQYGAVLKTLLLADETKITAENFGLDNTKLTDLLNDVKSIDEQKAEVVEAISKILTDAGKTPSTDFAKDLQSVLTADANDASKIALATDWKTTIGSNAATQAGETDIKGYVVTPKAYAADTFIKVKGENWTATDAKAELTKLEDTASNATLAEDKIYQSADKSMYFTKRNASGIDAVKDFLTPVNDGNTYYVSADGSFGTTDTTGTTVDAYTVKADADLEAIVKVAEEKYSNQSEWETYRDGEIAKVTEIKTPTKGNSQYVLAADLDTVKAKTTDANNNPLFDIDETQEVTVDTVTGQAEDFTTAVQESDLTAAIAAATKLYPFGKDTKAEAETYAKTVFEAAYQEATAAKAVRAAVNLDTDKLTGATLKSVRFYAGNGADLFEMDAADSKGSGKWEKGTKGGSRGYVVDDNATDKSAVMKLETKGTTGAASVKAYVTLEGTDGNTVTEEYVLNLKIVKAADFGTQSVRMTKSGSKTLADKDLINLDSGSKSLSGYEIRTEGGVEVADGNVGTIKADGEVRVDDGKTGDIIEANGVKVSGATVGNIVDAAGSVELTEGAVAGKITTDGATGVKINDATVSSIDADCPIDMEGGEINGNVITTGGTITITSEDEDADGDIMDVIINGSVISKGQGEGKASGKVSIDNESDEGAAEITIRGDVIARYANTSDDEESVKIGSSNTTGTISIGGAVQGEHIVLGGNGLVTLGAVNAVNEVERKDDEGIVVDSTLEFQGFNAGINNINKFANVTVSEGTVSVVSPLTTTTLDVQSDTQIVLAAMTVEDITGDGNIVVPAGQMVINGNVDDTPSLTLLGDVEVGTLAYSGDKGLSEAFDLGGLTLKAERQTNGTFNYTVSKQELYGVKAVGKNVTVGKEQAKSVSVVTDAALPQGASILWRSDDAEVATVEGNGNTATITGVDIGSVDVTATIVDANGRDLGYENATFNVDVLHANTIEVVGSEIALDTKAVGLDVGQSYSFLVRENSDVDNITLSYDSNIVDVALAQADYNGRGALYTITAKANGSTNVTVNYKGASSSVAVKVGGFKLDTAKKDLAPGQTYSFLAKNVPADQAANVKLEYDTNVATVALAQADYNGRGALFTVTGNQVGSTEIKATYNNEEAVMAVNVVEYTGRMTLDTASYTMPFGGTYTIGVKIEQNGRQLSGEEVNAMIARGELRVRDSRTGTIINAPQVLANGNVRVTGKSTEGTTYVLFEVIQNGQVVTHASVGVTVQAGATASGSSRRSISQW